MTDPELTALLQGCKDAPEDDAPRLVLADWLEEHGQADRAEFIRLQLRLAAGEVAAGEEARVIARLHELYLRHAASWVGGLERWTDRWHFRRGLIEVHARVETLRGELPDALAPWLETLVFNYGRQKSLGELSERKALAAFTSLDLTDMGLSPPWLERLAVSPHLTGLRRLAVKLSGSPRLCGEVLARAQTLSGLRVLDCPDGLAEATLLALIDSPWLAQLRSLTTRFSGSPRTVHALAQMDPGPRLRRLDWSYLRPGEAALRALVAAPLLAEVEELQLNESQFDGAGLAVLGTRRDWPRLRHLSLAGIATSSASLAALADVPLTGLRRLTLTRSQITPEILASLLAAPWMAGLTRLDLAVNPLGDEAVAALARTPAVGNLRHLDLSRTGLGPAGVHALANSPYLARLETLDLDANVLTDAGLAALANATGLPSLSALSLNSVHLTVDGLRQLAHSPLAARLKRLELSGNSLSGKDLFALATTQLAGLEELRLDRNPLGKEGVRALASAPFRGLVRLEMVVTHLQEGSVAGLLATHGFASLSVLNLWHAGVGPADKATLLAWPRLAHLAHLGIDPHISDARDFVRLARPIVFDARW